MPQENLLNHTVMLRNYTTPYPSNRGSWTPHISVDVWFDLSVLCITSYTIIIIAEYSVPINISNGTGGGVLNEKEIIRIPHSLPKDIFTIIKQIDASYSECDTKSDARRIVDRIKKQIEDKLDEDPILKKLQKLNIVDEIEQLKKSILPSKEITELQKTTSSLQYTTSQFPQILQDMNKKSRQTELVMEQLLQEKKQEKEKHDSEMLSMKSCIQQLQEDMKMLFRKTSELHYENTVLTKMVEEEKIKTKLSESTGLSFTQANTIGQALMKEDIFNCM